MKPYLERLFKSNIPLADHTTFRIGGPVRFFCAADNEEQLCAAVEGAHRAGIQWSVIGEGSNVLAPDTPAEQAVIAYRSSSVPRIDGDTVIVSGGLSLQTLVDFCMRNGIAGVERLAGIPGTVGGAIAGNAGAYGSHATDMLISVRLLRGNGAIETVPRSELGLCYRSSAVKMSGAVVLEARFRRIERSVGELHCIVEETHSDRQAKHPDYRRHPTAGSYFKNLPPPPGEQRRLAAGKLLEEVGAKGMRVGDAAPWPDHANILVNWGRACASDVRALAEEMAARVEDRFGIVLEPEITLLD